MKWPRLISLTQRLFYGSKDGPKATYSPGLTPTTSREYESMNRYYRWFRQDELVRGCMITNAFFACMSQGFETVLEPAEPQRLSEQEKEKLLKDYAYIESEIDELNKKGKTCHLGMTAVPIFEVSRTRNQGPGRIQQAKKRNRSDKKSCREDETGTESHSKIFKNATCFIFPNQQQPKQNTMLKHPLNHLQQHNKSPKTKQRNILDSSTTTHARKSNAALHERSPGEEYRANLERTPQDRIPTNSKENSIKRNKLRKENTSSTDVEEKHLR